jgi:para-aminobenzoate synthetase component 1
VRLSRTFKVQDSGIKKRLLNWAASQQTCCVLNSNRDKQTFEDPYSNYDFIVAIGAQKTLLSHSSRFEELQKFIEATNDYIFGYLTYDLKNRVEDLDSNNFDGLGFPELYFFQPHLVITLQSDDLKIEYLADANDIDSLFSEITNFSLFYPVSDEAIIQQRIPKADYISTVKKIKEHIQRGDIYEMNYCMEFYANAQINPAEVYWKLNEISPMPFSAFFKTDNHYAICASPERFLAKRGSKIISQPIKGTARRDKSKEKDDEIKLRLRNSAKEQSENVMIVDLVRNDLSRTAKKSSVKVEELFGIYSFSHLHHMVSTVVSEMRDDVSIIDVIKNAFPMGSMTGAPKIRAMELIEEYEKNKRGLFSGSIGYINPEKDFDFNVVIRSILYNASEKYLSFMVGSAITANSDEEKEYEECLLKAKAMLNVLAAGKF